MDLSVIVDNFRYFMVGLWPEGPLQGAAITAILSLTSGALSAVVGIVFGIMLACCPRWARIIIVPILGFFRSIPIAMLIFVVYFVLPKLVGVHGTTPPMLTITLSLGTVGGAYLAYSVAAGINSIPKGQWRAGKALGLSWPQVMGRVILPQALPRMLPSFVNQWVSLIKDTSLAYIISTADLTFLARQVSNTVMTQPAVIYLFVALIYFICCSLLDVLAVGLRKTLSGKTV
ncbi:amino acid ABC transporter permease [Zymobacter palmae]|uniref:ABC-type amino acid transport system, permease n=1 Tax=Zymobacter palmae TaxID=33074 RepID=A0A348HC64_9GAMM|nr:amino acid ABC transporter permease [Zymobacter palmae]BBG29216.1 ABC-type amino acid transport system, permease [Zymobacter palmae]